MKQKSIVKLITTLLAIFAFTTEMSAQKYGISIDDPLGMTYDQIKAELKKKNIEFEENKAKEEKPSNEIVIHTTNSYDEAYYCSKETDICTVYLILPNSQGRLNGLVEEYNNKYVVKSNIKWLYYSSNGIIRILLFLPEQYKDIDLPLGFYFTREE